LRVEPRGGIDDSSVLDDQSAHAVRISYAATLGREAAGQRRRCDASL
jgi:hypothetical protein